MCSSPSSHSGLTDGVQTLLDVGIPVGKPPFEIVPYGGHRVKGGANVNTWDESDEEDLESSEEEASISVSRVSERLHSNCVSAAQGPPRGSVCILHGHAIHQFRTFLTDFIAEAQVASGHLTSERLQRI